MEGQTNYFKPMKKKLAGGQYATMFYGDGTFLSCGAGERGKGPHEQPEAGMQKAFPDAMGK
jgi:hypothetical protein